MNDSAIQSVYQAVIISKLMYGSSVWWGFASPSDRQWIQAFIRRSERSRFTPPDLPLFTDLCCEADDNLFNSILNNRHHVLHHLLPPPSQASQHYSLRSRRHYLQLSITPTSIMTETSYLTCFKRTHTDFIGLNRHLTLPPNWPNSPTNLCMLKSFKPTRYTDIILPFIIYSRPSYCMYTVVFCQQSNTKVVVVVVVVIHKTGSAYHIATTPEDKATAIGNMHKNLVNIARVVPEISLQTNRQTDRQTDRRTYSLQYFAAVPAGEVTMRTVLCITATGNRATNSVKPKVL